MIEQYLENLPTIMKYMAAVGGIIVALKPITMITPTKVDDKALAGFGKVYNIVMKGLNILVLNIGKDKNKDA